MQDRVFTLKVCSFESTGTNLYAIAQFDDVQTVDEVGGVFH